MKTWLSVDLQGRTQPVVLPLRRIPACGPGGGAGSKQIRAARRGRRGRQATGESRSTRVSQIRSLEFHAAYGVLSRSIKLLALLERGRLPTQPPRIARTPGPLALLGPPRHPADYLFFALGPALIFYFELCAVLLPSWMSCL